MAPGLPPDRWTLAARTAAHAGLRPVAGRGWHGRDREWKVLADSLQAAEGGRGGVLLVAGESGIGKTRLLAQAAEAAAARGFVLSRGGADETARLTPLAPLIAALGEPHPIRLTSVRTERPDATDQRLRLERELHARLEERAARGPQLVTLDDLQWADPTTLLALRTLVPELASYPLLWILSRTTGCGDPAVERLYKGLVCEGATTMTLQAVDDQAVAAIVTDVLGATPEPDVLTLAAGAGGNPFILLELLGGLRDEGALEISGGRARLVSQCLPERVRTIARHRLSRLSPQSRHLLQVAAVLGRSFHARDVADMMSESPSRLLPTVEEARAAGVVIPTGDMLAFRHDLLWRAVTETIPASMRQALHRQAAEMLLGRGGPAIRAATHLLDSAAPSDPAVLAGLDRAAREVLSYSPPTAADLAIRVLELTTPADPSRFARTVTAICALTNAGRLIEAAELSRTALARTTQPVRAARLRYELANTLLLAGHAGDSVTEAENALADPSLSDDLRGLAEQVMFFGMFVTHDRRGRERAQAIAAADRHSAPARVGANMLLTTLAWADGRAADAIGHVREATRIAAGGPLQARHKHPRLHLVSLLTDTRQIAEAETALRVAEEEISDLSHTTFTAAPALFRARLRLVQARLDDAVAEAQAGLGIADKVGMHVFDLLGFAVLAIVAVHRGDLDAAATYVERYESMYRSGQGATYGYGWAAWARTLVTEAQAGQGAAVNVFHGHFDDSTKQQWLLMTEPNAAAWLTRTALTANDRPTAETFTAAARRLAHDNPGFPTYGASAAHAQGILTHDPTALAQAATAHLDPWSGASASEDLGVLHAHGSSGQAHDAAVQSLDQALEGYQRAGATRDAARVRARLRRLGVRRRHWKQSEHPVTGWASLTETERDIAVLVARGLTNPQVAAQMFISRHTVKFHLGQIFRKLDVNSRVELARVAVQSSGDT